MPVYEFTCSKCATEFQELRSIAHMDDPAKCPKCGQPGQRLVSVFGSKVDWYMRAPHKEAFRKKPAS